MAAQSKGYLQYNGSSSVFTFGERWPVGHQVSLETLAKKYGERAGDADSGPVFVSWIESRIINKPDFSLHLTESALTARAEFTGGTTVVESGPVTTATSQEQAASQLTKLRQQQVSTHGEQIPVNIDSRQGKIETSPEPDAQTVRAANRVSSVKEILAAQKIGTQAMTGDMLNEENDSAASGGLNAHSPATAPLVPFQGEARPSNAHITEPQAEKRAEVVSKVFLANPSPTVGGQGPENVGGTSEEVLTPVETSNQDLSNIKAVDQTMTPASAAGNESAVMTGDSLDSASRGSSDGPPTSEASTAGGQTRPAVQGSAAQAEVTLDHIVRAADVHQAIDAVNNCKNRSLLTLAKRQLDNDGSRASQRISSKVSARITFLKQRGH
ncbi:MAG: hypothetical protein DRQ40_02010 [Gammaproteobacteria bacterium]|nr:MAG: hypothetical protein DRQ40_02010 [Gammaproteobacteria bacterium]